MYTRYTAPVALPDTFGHAVEALRQGRGADAAGLLVRALKQPGLTRDETLQLRCALAEAWFQQDDIRQAGEALGPPPDERERLHPARLSELWRLHGRLAIARGEPSRAIALLGRALKSAERAHDSRAIGLTHYDLGICYRQVGDTAIVRDHIAQAASALHAAGDQRSLALVHSLSGVSLAQDGRLDEAMTALRQAERLALMVRAGDVVATVSRESGERGDDAASPRPGAGAGGAQRRASGGVGHAARPGHRAGVARPNQRETRESAAGRARAQPRSRRAESAAVHARDDRRGVRHARADPPDSRQPRGGGPLPASRPAKRTATTTRAAWYHWSVQTLEARVALRRGEAGDGAARPRPRSRAPMACRRPTRRRRS